jgi:hypothetical protein
MRSMTLALPTRRQWPAAISPRIRVTWDRISFRTIIFGLAWAFILLAAAYDTYFAWQYWSVLDAWEMNPVIVWLASYAGLPGVFTFKLFSMVFSTGLAIFCHHRRHRLEIPFTLVIGGAYFLLSFHYIMSYLQG